MTAKDPKATKETKATKAQPTTVAASTKPLPDPKEKPVQKKVRATKTSFVDVTVKVHGLEDYKNSGKRANTMKAVRAWIRQRGLSVRIEGVKQETSPDPKSAGENEFITYIFDEATLKAAGITPKAPAERTSNAEKAKDAGKKEAKAPAKPKVNIEAEKPDEATAPADW